MGVWVGKLNLKRRSIDFHAPTELQRLLPLLAGLFPSRAQHKSFPAKPSPGQRKHPAANPNRSEHLCMLLCFRCRCCREFGARVHHYAIVYGIRKQFICFLPALGKVFSFFLSFFLLQQYVTFGHSSNKVYKGRCTFVFFSSSRNDWKWITLVGNESALLECTALTTQLHCTASIYLACPLFSFSRSFLPFSFQHDCRPSAHSAKFNWHLNVNGHDSIATERKRTLFGASHQMVRGRVVRTRSKPTASLLPPTPLTPACSTVR